ncbi:protogenin isoform X2 [Bombus vancouverensis nearcticus]|uniref:Protogenin-like isoform X2 n=1 Tax=Bombus bifarius TaxID=103933 RepID=A0A6P8NDE6_9HYME|nr:protogenin-like isoform X2 [Bombus bifarius]
MAARVLLLSILFTEVLKPAYAAGVKEIGTGLHNKNVSKSESFNISPTKSSGITLEIQPSGHVILGKKGVTLTCITGPNQNISWLHNGIPAPPCGIARCTILKNGSLHLHKMVQKFKEKNSTTVNFKDYYKDEYRCVTRTNLGLLRSSPTFIHIAELAHVFKKSPENITVQEGEIARLSCLIDSVPFPPNITWQHNEKILLPNQSNLNSKYIMVPPGVLYIKATKLSDAGSYRCIVNNEFLKKTKKSKEAKLTVISRPEGNGSHIPPLLFPQISYNHWLLNGSNLSLVCAASGYPPPLMMWSFIPRYTGNHNVAQPRISLNSSIGITILSLVNVSASDAGVYVCSVKNSVTNNVKIQNVTVDILIPPSFVKIPTNQVCPNGRTARFECQAQGLPVPKIYWLKDSLNITINGRRTIYTKEFNKMELAISATVPSDSGIYQCVAVNSVGEIWAAGRLQVNTSRNSPAAPTSLKCRALSPVKIFISWEPPKSLSHSSIKAYTVHYSPVGGKEEVSPPEPGNSTSVEVTKLLEPYTNYSFYIRVWNNYGPSDQSATILCSTAPSVPKGAPKVNANILSSTKLNVSWEPLPKKESRGVVVQYKLQLRLHEHPSSRVLHLPADVDSYVFSDLIPGAQYDLRVLARTKQGWPNVSESQLEWITVTMPPAESNQFIIKNVVDVQVLIINASIVKMKWKINVRENNIIETEFDLWQIYCENQSGHKLATIFLPQNVTEYVFTNLDVNVSYTMGLCMISSGETTGCLTKQIHTIQLDTNNVPMALEAIPVSPTSINVTWSLNGVHEVNSFELCYHAIHVANSDGPKCFILNDTKANIDKLKPFTLYQFKVRAIQNNTNQSNFYSESVECYTNEDIPGKVEEVQWFLVNNTKVRIAWKEPSNINGIIQNYFVIYTMDLTDSATAWRNVTVLGNKTSTTLPGLTPGKRYFVMVQAMTKAGYGKPSDPIIIITGGSSKVPSPPDEQKPPQNTKPDQSLGKQTYLLQLYKKLIEIIKFNLIIISYLLILGVILGVSISIGFITICLCSIYCRKKCENARILRESAQSTKGRASVRNGNRCCADQSSTSVSQQMNTRITPNEIELAVLCPTSPITTNPHLDTKGGKSNGILESCVKEPLLPSWEINGEPKDIHITKNSQYKTMDSVVLSTQKQEQEPEQDLDGTQLTVVNCTLGSSNSSLNNNSGCPDGDTSLPKPICISVPALGPNG